MKTKCEVYSRTVGYIRPINQWNNGKRAEFNDRKMLKAYFILLLFLMPLAHSFNLCEELYPTNVTKYVACIDYFEELNQTTYITNNITKVTNLTNNITYNITEEVINNITNQIREIQIINLTDTYTKDKIDLLLHNQKQELLLFLKDDNSDIKTDPFEEITRLLLLKQLGLTNSTTVPIQSKSTTDELTEMITFFQLLQNFNNPNSQEKISSTINESKLLDTLTDKIESEVGKVKTELQSQINNNKYQEPAKEETNNNLLYIVIIGLIVGTGYFLYNKNKVKQIHNDRRNQTEDFISQQELVKQQQQMKNKKPNDENVELDF